MCSIMGYCGSGADYQKFQKGFDRTISRGPDESRIIDTGNGLLGFHRLAIMGLTSAGMQPFSMDGSYVVCNGEIYGFEGHRAALEAKGYQFQNGSDCEILRPTGPRAWSFPVLMPTSAPKPYRNPSANRVEQLW